MKVISSIRIRKKEVNYLLFADDIILYIKKPKLKVKVKSLSHVQLFPTPWTVAHQAPVVPGILAWDSPGKNTGVGCHFLLQNPKTPAKNYLTDFLICQHFAITKDFAKWPKYLPSCFEFPMEGNKHSEDTVSPLQCIINC